MYAGVPLASALGAGGASALASRRRSGFDTLATVVAATTLLMAGVSVCKLLPRRRTGTVLTDRPPHIAPERLALRLPGERNTTDAWVEVP
ncbi:hypothetical protein ACF09I_32585 [Streptomyces sp. NPDC014940]|uniref:hypothetical protein n=1 Tax=Streptomyces sp. NPDC014940 TaxID=3364932 RepID=UPI0036F8A09D